MDAPTAALIGVVLGALLAGGANLALERYKQLKLAQSARRLIAPELRGAATKVQFAIDKNRWWEGELPTAQWQAHAHDVTLGLSTTDFDKLAALYDSMFQWNLAKPKDDEAPFDETHLDELREDKRSYDQWHDYLSLRYRVRGLSQLVTAAKVALVVLIAAVTSLSLFTAGDALFLPRPVVNSRTVAAAIQSQLGSQDLVECTPSGSDWSCTDYRLSGLRSTCQVADAQARVPTAALVTGEPAATPACTQTPQRLSASVNGDQVVASATTATQDKPMPIYRGSLQQKNLIDFFIAWLRNQDP